MALGGKYGDKSERPLSNTERDQIGRLLSDPLSFPDTFKFWLEHQINQPEPQRRGRWKVFDSDIMHERTGLWWSGQMNGRGWSHDVPGVTQFVGGCIIGWDNDAGELSVDTWSNTFDDKDRQWMPKGTYQGANFFGWTRNQQIIRGRLKTPHTYPGNILMEEIWLESRDGLTETKIADIADEPFFSNGAFELAGYPVESLTPNSEGRVLIYDSGNVDSLAIYDPALGTTVHFVDYAAQLGHYCQRGNNNLYSGPYPVTNLGRHGLGLRILQEPENNFGSYELFDATGTTVCLLDGGGAGGLQTWQAKFSPDGRWLVYNGASYTPDFHTETWLIDLLTNTQTRLGPDECLTEFAWSPNSDYLFGLDENFRLVTCSIPDGYVQKIVDTPPVGDPGGGDWNNPQWQGNTMTAELDSFTLGEPRQICEIKPKTGEIIVLDDYGTTTYGSYSYDNTNMTPASILSPNGKYLAYAKCNPAFAAAPDFYYVNDVWVTETYGLAGS